MRKIMMVAFMLALVAGCASQPASVSSPEGQPGSAAPSGAAPDAARQVPSSAPAMEPRPTASRLALAPPAQVQPVGRIEASWFERTQDAGSKASPRYTLINATGLPLDVRLERASDRVAIDVALLDGQSKDLALPAGTYSVQVGASGGQDLRPHEGEHEFEAGCRYATRFVLSPGRQLAHQVKDRCRQCGFAAASPGTCPFCAHQERLASLVHPCSDCGRKLARAGKCSDCRKKEEAAGRQQEPIAFSPPAPRQAPSSSSSSSTSSTYGTRYGYRYTYKCSSCSYTSDTPGTCPRCVTYTITYRCSRCGWTQNTPGVCPVCR